MPGARGEPLSHVLTPIFALGCVFANFTFGYVGGYALNGSAVALAAAAVLTLLIVGRVPKWPLLAVAILVAVVAVKAFGTLNIEESAKAGAQIIAAALCLCVFSIQRGNLVGRHRFSLLFGRLMSWHALLLIAQWVALNGFGSTALQNPFGPFSAIGPAGELGALPGAYLPFDDGVMRPNGFYSEPSVAAAYTVFALACILATDTLRRRQKIVMSLLLAVGALVTFALTGWVMLAGVLFCHLLFGRMKSASRLHLSMLAAVMTAAAAWLGGAYLAGRIEGAGQFGGSIYIRFIGPFSLVKDVLGTSPLGLPINDPTFLLTRDYLVDFAGRRFFVLDNFYVWLVVYFGLPGVAFIAWCLMRLFRALRARAPLALPLVALALFAAATGSGYNSVFVLPLAVALSLVRSPAAAPVAAMASPAGALIAPP